MSSPLAGKFQDHYEVLGVETNAELSTIERVHSELSQKFDPRNPETGDAEKWETVQLAFEVLSKPDTRKSFDTLKGVGEDKNNPKFSGMEFFEAFGRDTSLRSAMLCILYDRRRSRPLAPSLSMRHLENILTVASDQLALVLWYLKQRGFVSSDDKSSLQITVEGMDYLEANRPTAEAVMPWIKPSALAAVTAPSPAPAPAAPPEEIDARRSKVDRILSRGTN
jgi:curved DNA-binding protein CbpA